MRDGSIPMKSKVMNNLNEKTKWGGRQHDLTRCSLSLALRRDQSMKDILPRTCERMS